jgi:antirestriction protein
MKELLDVLRDRRLKPDAPSTLVTNQLQQRNATMPQKITTEEREAWAAYVGHYGKGHATVERFREQCSGDYESRQAYAEYYLEQVEGVKKDLLKYIDFDLYINSLDQDILFVDHNDRVYVFHIL